MTSRKGSSVHGQERHGVRRTTVAAALTATVLTGTLAPMAFAGATAPPDFTTLSTRPITQSEAPLSSAGNATMIVHAGGTYRLGRDQGASDQRPAHQVQLEGFRMDRTEVTNAAFAEYLNALALDVRGSAGIAAISSANAAPAILALLREGGEGSGIYPIIALDDDEARIEMRDGRFVPSAGFADHPVAETTWAGALAYCRWRGGRLPTEAEWEAAARSSDDRLYPWGDAAPDPALVSASGRTGETAPAGSRPRGASAQGVLDLSGSMAEWTSSLKMPYPYRPEDGREDAAAPGERVTRGGDYRFDRSPETLTVSHRNGFSNAPDRGHRHIGFRCVASP